VVERDASADLGRINVLHCISIGGNYVSSFDSIVLVRCVHRVEVVPGGLLEDTIEGDYGLFLCKEDYASDTLQDVLASDLLIKKVQLRSEVMVSTGAPKVGSTEKGSEPWIMVGVHGTCLLVWDRNLQMCSCSRQNTLCNTNKYFIMRQNINAKSSRQC
jgi:hypothetical protein